MSAERSPRAYLTLADLAAYPTDDGNRYELIDGVLHVTTSPHWHHQYTVHNLGRYLGNWVEQTGNGLVLPAPGVIFGPGDAVAPDLVWLSPERLHLLNDDGKLHGAPDLAVEVLSAGRANEQRDRQAKRQQYARFGVGEYWIVDRFARQVEVYRRAADDLVLVATLPATAELTSPRLPGFGCLVGALFVSARSQM